MAIQNQVQLKPMANRNRARRVAFSLLELIIVLMVMIGLLAIAWPNLQRPLRRNSLNESAQTLRVAIDESRYQAITAGGPMFVRLRQGYGIIEAGTFESFSNDLAALDMPRSAGPNESGKNLANGALASQSNRIAKISTWQLPESVVIESVRWTLEPHVDPMDNMDSADAESSPVPIDADVAGLSQGAEYQVEEGLSGDLAASQAEWWLPLIATGQGRDAAIVLFDTAINEQVTVTYASATGALEIVR